MKYERTTRKNVACSTKGTPQKKIKQIPREMPLQELGQAHQVSQERLAERKSA